MSKGLKVAASVALVIIIISGIAVAWVFFFTTGGDGGARSSLETVVLFTSFFAVTTGGGSVALYYLLRSPVLNENSPKRLPSSLWLFGAFGLSVIIGTAILSAGIAERVLFPPVHILAATLPGLALLVLVARLVGNRGLEHEEAQSATGSATPRRTISFHRTLGSLFLGSYLAVPIAIVVELVAAALVFLILFIVLRPAGLGAAPLGNMLEGADILTSGPLNPALLAGIGIVLVIVAPMIEEFAKSLGVLLSKSYNSASQSMLAGAAAGVGFALVENVFYTSFSVSAWTVLVLFRVATILIHTAASSIAGFGWYAARAQKKLSRFLAGYAGACVLHGLWNGATFGIVILSLNLQNGGTAALAATSAGALALMLLMLLLLAGSAWSLVYMGRRVRTVV